MLPTLKCTKGQRSGSIHGKWGSHCSFQSGRAQAMCRFKSAGSRMSVQSLPAAKRIQHRRKKTPPDLSTEKSHNFHGRFLQTCSPARRL
ncbi:hypothetical protein FKM82_018849 [Ascaphus truei]